MTKSFQQEEKSDYLASFNVYFDMQAFSSENAPAVHQVELSVQCVPAARQSVASVALGSPAAALPSAAQAVVSVHAAARWVGKARCSTASHGLGIQT